MAVPAWYPNDKNLDPCSFYLVVPNKGHPDYPPNPCNLYSVTSNKGNSQSHSTKQKERTAFSATTVSK